MFTSNSCFTTDLPGPAAIELLGLPAAEPRPAGSPWSQRVDALGCGLIPCIFDQEGESTMAWLSWSALWF